MSKEEKEEKELEEQKTEEPTEPKKHDFLSEELIPLTKRVVRMKRFKVGITVVFLAVLFGILARMSYLASDFLLNELMYGDRRQEVSLDNPKVTPGPGNGNTSSVEINSDALAHYSETMKGIGQAAAQLASCLVTIEAVEEIEDQIFHDVTELVREQSGVIVADNRAELIVMTAYEKLGEYDSLRCTFYNGQTLEAELSAYDEELNIAILRASYEGGGTSFTRTLSVLSFGDSGSVGLGTPVLAIGSPNGMVGSIDFGFVTGIGEVAQITDNSVALLTTNMSVYPEGGGVLVDVEGRLVGILCYELRKNEQVCTAISVSSLVSILDRMINERPQIWFGVRFEELSAAERKSLGIENGIFITEVDNNSPAYEAQFKQGDVITALVSEGTDHPVQSAAQFNTLLHTFGEDAEVTVVFYRNGKQMKTELTLSAKK